MDSPTHETDVHDLSLGVIHALRMVDEEIAVRSETTDSLGETVRIHSPKKRTPPDEVDKV